MWVLYVFIQKNDQYTVQTVYTVQCTRMILHSQCTHTRKEFLMCVLFFVEHSDNNETNWLGNALRSSFLETMNFYIQNLILVLFTYWSYDTFATTICVLCVYVSILNCDVIFIYLFFLVSCKKKTGEWEKTWGQVIITKVKVKT